MLTLPTPTRPDWPWLPEISPGQIYTWALFRLEEERYWQIAWSEYKQRRSICDKGYKAKPEDQKLWQELGKQLYITMTDPQLFIELLFAEYMTMDKPRAPLVTELLPKLETISLWFNPKYTPDAEGDLILAGTNMTSFLQRYPDTSVDYWLNEKGSEFPPYFHLLFSSSTKLSAKMADFGSRQVIRLPILRALEILDIWPKNAHIRLMNARRIQK